MAVLVDRDRHHFLYIFLIKMNKKFAGFKKKRTFASAFDKNV